MHASQTQAKAYYLKMQLQTTKKGNSSMEVYVQKMRTIAENMTISLTPISDIELVSSILFGLDDDYDNLITSIYTRGSEISLNTVLLNHEARLKQMRETEMSVNLAAKTYPNKRSFSSSSRSFDGNSAFKQHSGNMFAKPNGNKPSCQICFKPGHTALKCYQGFNQGPGNDTGNDFIKVGNGASLSILNIGNSSLLTNSAQYLHLNNVLHVSSITKNLLSVSQLTKHNNIYLEFHSSHCFVKDLQGRTLLTRTVDQGLYKFHPSTLPAFNKTTSSTLVRELTFLDVWHKRLGHSAMPIVHRIINVSKISVSKSSSNVVCSSCQMAKSHKLPFSESKFVSTAPLELVFSDIWAERRHTQIVETGLALLANASMSIKYWDDAFQSAVFLINRLPTKSLGYSSPLQQATGYNNHHKGCKCLEVSTNRVYISRHVILYESTSLSLDAKLVSSSTSLSSQPCYVPLHVVSQIPSSPS
ncbi:hypothetical protein LIER_39779 [Lithospermum erythrorhizon]|uniref:GAG-pre-integrase domain-containing protein n=1 Tax=Lithospermum erythrorhizon TaxID=34254 RepID=A0AAV3QNR1_LITER